MAGNDPADTPRIYTAIVDSDENADFENFHENTAYNAGLSYKWFTDIEEAVSWLKDKIKTNYYVKQQHYQKNPFRTCLRHLVGAKRSSAHYSNYAFASWSFG